MTPNRLADDILELIMAECRYWHSRDEARRGGFANLYASASALIDKAKSATEPVHSTQDNYEHFLSYSGLADDPLIRYAYFHGADEGIDKPEPVQGEAAEVVAWLK